MNGPSRPATPTRTRYRILVVCSANRCRSPAMQFLLQAALGRGYAVRSAGVDAVDGASIHPLTAQALSGFGIDASEFRSRSLQIPLIEQADLILTAEATHRSAVVSLRPNAVNRTFTMLQFARLVRFTGDRPRGGLEHAIDVALRHRVGAAGDDDLADPVALPLSAHVAMTQLVAEAAATIAVAAGVPAIVGPVTGSARTPRTR